jgi:hypothetical protein
MWYADFLDVSIEAESQLNPFGAVRSGKLTLFGPVAWLPDALFEHHDDDWSRFQETGLGLHFENRRSTSSSNSTVESLLKEAEIWGSPRERDKRAGEVRSDEGRFGDKDPEYEYFSFTPEAGHTGLPGDKDSTDDDDQTDRSDIRVFNASSSAVKEGPGHENQTDRREHGQRTHSYATSSPSRSALGPRSRPDSSSRSPFSTASPSC